ncbi:MAG TPA: hypothetical protein VMH37_19695 [Candidatus Binataceae bacterium]|nr:hypothetical protein [Candidatus Binataceae bacterium]HVN90282.1 hypothetical protein [Candidatus Binataceae bacterium]
MWIQGPPNPDAIRSLAHVARTGEELADVSLNELDNALFEKLATKEPKNAILGDFPGLIVARQAGVYEEYFPERDVFLETGGDEVFEVLVCGRHRIAEDDYIRRRLICGQDLVGQTAELTDF